MSRHNQNRHGQERADRNQNSWALSVSWWAWSLPAAMFALKSPLASAPAPKAALWLLSPLASAPEPLAVLLLLSPLAFAVPVAVLLLLLPWASAWLPTAVFQLDYRWIGESADRCIHAGIAAGIGIARRSPCCRRYPDRRSHRHRGRKPYCFRGTPCRSRYRSPSWLRHPRSRTRPPRLAAARPRRASPPSSKPRIDSVPYS